MQRAFSLIQIHIITKCMVAEATLGAMGQTYIGARLNVCNTSIRSTINCITHGI